MRHKLLLLLTDIKTKREKTMKPRTLLIIVLLAWCSPFFSQVQENYRVDELGPGLWRIQAIQGTLSTAYVIEGTREALVIDACTGQDGLKETVQRLTGDKPVKLALTHGHFDHSGGIKYFSDVYLHAADTGLIPKGTAVNLHFIDDGYVFDLGEKKIKVIGIPGHTPGSLAFYDVSGRNLFTGDGIGSTSVWMQISNLPLTTFLATLKKLEAMKDAIAELYVGHHEQEKVKLTTQYITDMRIVTEKVLDGSIASSDFNMGDRSGKQATYGSATLVYSPERLR